ncbi:MAG: hypothetical protein JWM16_5317 [Verrucomicrobiales bacterium]|nr:hypothetical protein [Verrucomicrobiales bacterium]
MDHVRPTNHEAHFGQKYDLIGWPQSSDRPPSGDLNGRQRPPRGDLHSKTIQMSKSERTLTSAV